MQKIDAEEKMEISSDQNDTTTSSSSSRPKGGLITMPFIIANESFEKVASYGLMPNMIFYLMKGYGMSGANGSSVLQLWSAVSNFTPLFGAFVSDSYLGRYRVITLGSISSLLGMILLWLTAMFPKAKPAPGESPSSAHYALLFVSFGLMSIGAGGIRPCSIAFGADQLIKKGNPKNERILESYFNWYYASIGISTIIALTLIVYIQDHLGWKIGFGIPAILMAFSVLMFFLGSPLYVKENANTSLFAGLAHVIGVTFKNRSLAYPEDGPYHYNKDSILLTPSKKLRFMNKACIVRNPMNDVNPDGTASKPWNLCTVDQVEALKSLIRILPIWSTGIIIFMSLTQGTQAVLQAISMDRHIAGSFEFPAGSFTVFTVIAVTIWVAFYDRVVVPLLAKYAGKPHGLSSEVRMGLGLVLSIVSMIVAAFVEIVRRRTAIREGLADNPRGIVRMSAMWLVPQFLVAGLAEGLNAVGQIEFFYAHLPKNMASLAMALFSLGNAFSGLLGSFLVKTVDKITSKGGKVSWVHNSPNKGHYDYYYWFLAILCLVNFLYFLVCCWVFGPSKEPRVMIFNEQDIIEVDKVSRNPSEEPKVKISNEQDTVEEEHGFTNQRSTNPSEKPKAKISNEQDTIEEDQGSTNKQLGSSSS